MIVVLQAVIAVQAENARRLKLQRRNAAEAERRAQVGPGPGWAVWRRPSGRMTAQSFVASLLANPCTGPRQLQWSRSWSSWKICIDSGSCRLSV